MDPDYGPIPFEIHINKSIRHPNIVHYIEMYEIEFYFMMVTEYHGTPWDADNPILSPQTNPGIKNEVGDLDPNQLEENYVLRRRTSCDLFECIGERYLTLV
jgi:hypothetical protein